MNVHAMVIARSGGRCEAMVRLPRTWTRCGRGGVEDHHVLTRARGGAVLDAEGEIYHHLALCPRHHRMVDDMGAKSGLLIEGYAYTKNGRVVYQGPDAYLSARYPETVPGEVHLPVVQGTVSSSVDDGMARGASL